MRREQIIELPVAAAPARESEPPRQMLDTSEVAAVLRCSRGVVCELLKSGEISHVRLGRLVRIPRKALDQFIDRKMGETENRSPFRGW